METTTNEEDCRVWLWGAAHIDEPNNVEYGTILETFLESCRTKRTVYFHNLAFDGSFIVDWLLRNGYKHRISDRMGFGHFSTLISKQGKFYSIKVRWPEGSYTEFRDSLKKLPMSVSEVAKAFKLSEGKGDLDYAKPRPVGYVPTADELDYLRRDVTIIAQAMATQYAAGMSKLTVGADSLSMYKKLIGEKNFLRVYPTLPMSIDTDIRASYRGGFTYVNPKFQARVIDGPGMVFDVNSLYPSVMYNCDMPYGHPQYFDGKYVEDSKMPLYVLTVTFTAALKENHIPCIQVKGANPFAAAVYLSVIDDPVTLTVTSVDWQLWNDHYDIDVLYWGGGWKFKKMRGSFNNYIDKWNAVKAKSEGGERVIAKLHLNSLYGKFATNPDVTSKIPILDENGDVRLVLGQTETRDPVYTPVGVFITAYAREITIRAAQANYDIFMYADTDSLHLHTNTIPEMLDVHPSRLGAWKHESNFDKAFYLRAKAYTERVIVGVSHRRVVRGRARTRRRKSVLVRRYDTHVAGLPRSIAASVRVSDFETGKIFTGKLVPKRVHGGIVLISATFTLLNPSD